MQYQSLLCLVSVLLIISVSSAASERRLSNIDRILESRRQQFNNKSLDLLGLVCNFRQFHPFSCYSFIKLNRLCLKYENLKLITTEKNCRVSSTTGQISGTANWVQFVFRYNIAGSNPGTKSYPRAGHQFILT